MAIYKGHLRPPEAKERHETNSPSQPRKEPTLPTLDFTLVPPELEDDKFLLFKTPSLWTFVTAALVN